MTDPCFAIVFGLDDNYAKYASVSMMSIIYSINPTTQNREKLIGGGQLDPSVNAAPDFGASLESCLESTLDSRQDFALNSKTGSSPSPLAPTCHAPLIHRFIHLAHITPFYASPEFSFENADSKKNAKKANLLESTFEKVDSRVNVDCHDFDKSKSRNDDKNAASKKMDSSSNAPFPSLRALAQDKARQSINKTPKASRDLPIHFHLLADSLSPSTLSRLRTLESHLDTIYPTQIHIHSLHQAEFKALNPWGEAGANWCAYFRLKLGSVLPQELTKALYLDVDTLILRDIRELFAYDLGECAIGAVRSGLSGDSIKIVREHKIHAQNYFNSGVLLINLPKWRTKDLALIHTKEYAEYAEYADQDFLNLIFRDSVCFLPYHYNLQWLAQSRIHFDSSPPRTDTNGIVSYPSAIDFSEFASALINPSIVHLLGGYKPWEKSNFQSNPAKPPIFAQNPYHKLWWAIARESPFARHITLAYYKRTALITITAYLRAYAPWAYAGLRPFVRVLKLLKSALSSPNPQRTHNAK